MPTNTYLTLLSTDSINFVFDYLPENSTILEFGSGKSTLKFLEKYKVFSIEHDPLYMEIDHPNHSYIYFSLNENNWYDNFVLPEIDYQFLIIDGPPAKGKYTRLEILNHLDKLKLDVPWLIDDTHRRGERFLKNKIEKIKNPKEIIEIGDIKKRTHILI